MARLFFAVASPPDVAAEVGRIQKRLRDAMGTEKATWPRIEHVHCTIKFLGEVPEDRARTAIACAAEVARGERPFDVTLHGVGAFPDGRRPQVLWIGVSSGSHEFGEFATRLDRRLAEGGFEPEGRPFVPHLTLARIKVRGGGSQAARALQSMADVAVVGTWRVASFSLYESRSTSDGVRYTAIETFAFRHDAGDAGHHEEPQ
jgi:RNA 2',3'-cyclic 3'-phosphodiesterase